MYSQFICLFGMMHLRQTEQEKIEKRKKKLKTHNHKCEM